jgi:hypothetical protein
MEKCKKKNSIKLETTVTVGFDNSDFDFEKRRAAILAALHAATTGLATTTSGLAGQAINSAADGGTVPWGEVIIEPIWQERNPRPEFGLDHTLKGSAEISFWD